MGDEATLAAIALSLREVGAKIDATRAEGAERGAKLDRDMTVLRHEVNNWATRIRNVEIQVRALTDMTSETKREVSEADHEVEATIAGAITHTARLETFVQRVAEDMELQSEKQDRVNNALCAVLGLDYGTISAAPTAELAKAAPPKTSLVTIARENKAGTVIGLITFMTVWGEILLKLLGK